MVDGDVWAVAYMPRERWRCQGHKVWYDVEKALQEGWAGKLDDGFRLVHGRPKEAFEGYGEAAMAKADELGAPVGQMFTVCALRTRSH